MASCENPKCPHAGENVQKTPKPSKKCSKCRVVGYCCKECQIDDWKRHKKVCLKELDWFAANDKFLLADVKGMGVGIFARRQLKEGEFLWQETPVIETKAPFNDNAKEDIRHQYAKLETDQKLEVDKLFDRASAEKDTENDQGEPDIVSIFDTNCSEWDSSAVEFDSSKADPNTCSDTDFMSLYLITSRMNHSCTPNVSMSHVSVEMLQARAGTTIEKGSELTTSYIEVAKPTCVRQDLLQTGWSFRCTCRTCRVANEKSDARRSRISLLMGPTTQTGSIDYLLLKDTNISPWLAATFAFTKAREVTAMAQLEKLHEWTRAGWFKVYSTALIIGQSKLALAALQEYLSLCTKLLGEEHPHVAGIASWNPLESSLYITRHRFTPSDTYLRYANIDDGSNARDAHSDTLKQLLSDAKIANTSKDNSLPFCASSGLCGLRCSNTTAPSLRKLGDVLHENNVVDRYFRDDPGFVKACGRVDDLHAPERVAERLQGAKVGIPSETSGSKKLTGRTLKEVDFKLNKTSFYEENSEAISTESVVLLPFQCSNCHATYCSEICFQRDRLNHRSVCSLFTSQGARTKETEITIS